MKEESNNYESPATTVVEVKIEGMVCQTSVNGMINPMGTPEDL